MKQHTASDIVFKSDLSTRARIVFMYLSYRSNKENTCFPSIKTIARESGMAVSTVKRALNDLDLSGYIEKNSRFRDDNGQTSNLYTLVEDVQTVAFNDENDTEILMEADLSEPDKVDEILLYFDVKGDIQSPEGESSLLSNTIHSSKGVQFDPPAVNSNRVPILWLPKMRYFTLCQLGEPPPSSIKYGLELVKANLKIKRCSRKENSKSITCINL